MNIFNAVYIEWDYIARRLNGRLEFVSEVICSQIFSNLFIYIIIFKTLPIIGS